ncbi:hypothetical protein GQ457_14G015350 [Hibiscus cannabinus]
MTDTSDNPEGQQPTFQVQAIIRELKRSLREELEPLHGGGFQSVNDEKKNDEYDIKFTKNSEILVVKRSLNIQPSQDDQQCENIFHTRFRVNDKDEVLCDVCSMDACHLLLGRSWQFYKRVVHDGYTNRYSFMHEGKKVILAPLTPSQVSEYQVRMKASIEAWEASKSKKASEEEKANSKDLSDSIFSSTSSDLQERKTVPYEVPKVASCDDSNTSLVLRIFQQPCSPCFDVSHPFDFISPSLHSDFFGCTLDYVPCIVNLIDRQDCDCSLELSSSFQPKEADTPSASSFQLIEAPFSSTSALLAQLKLNNPEVAETHPVQERVSYEHVDSKRGVLHLSMHMHNMCGSLGMVWACGRDLGTSQACGWLNQPLSLHLFPPKWCENTLQMCGSHSIRPKEEFAYNIPRSVTFEETTFRQVTSYHIWLSSSPFFLLFPSPENPSPFTLSPPAKLRRAPHRRSCIVPPPSLCSSPSHDSNRATVVPFLTAVREWHRRNLSGFPCIVVFFVLVWFWLSGADVVGFGRFRGR